MKTKHSESGFTLIELMTVVSILSILSAIAFRQLSAYQGRAFDARAVHDLRMAAVAEEAYFSENEEYAPCSDSECEHTFSRFSLSEGTRITLSISDTRDAYVIEAYHPKGNKRYHFDSDSGSLRSS